MKTNSPLLILLVALTWLNSALAQVGIVTTNPDNAAALDITATDKGLLPPRMTNADRDNISNPPAGLTVWCTNCGSNGEMQVFNGTEWTNMIGGTASIYVPTVTNPTTGEIWMDRNLGASQVATSSTDLLSYGDLYQWGRAADGHESRSSSTTNTLATTAVPNGGNAWDGLYILPGSSPFNWLSPADDNLWQGVSGTNNPCPDGFRLPTSAEWTAERLSWTSNDATGAFNSVLKLPLVGFRSSNGSLLNVGSQAYYWSSTVTLNSSQSVRLFFASGFASSNSEGARGNGFAVRCIKG